MENKIVARHPRESRDPFRSLPCLSLKPKIKVDPGFRRDDEDS